LNAHVTKPTSGKETILTPKEGISHSWWLNTNKIKREEEEEQQARECHALLEYLLLSGNFDILFWFVAFLFIDKPTRYLLSLSSIQIFPVIFSLFIPLAFIF